MRHYCAVLLFNNYSINRTHGRFTPKLNIMNLEFTMVDVKTGEIFARSKKTLLVILPFLMMLDFVL